MPIKKEIITKGFIFAGLMNLSVIIFSRLFTNTVIPEFDAIVMSNFGLVMIAVWGLAYMSVAKSYYNVMWLIGLFAIEKFIYGFVWVKWMLNNNIYDVFEKDIMAGMFYATYGVNDWLFCVFFLFVFINLVRAKEQTLN